MLPFCSAARRSSPPAARAAAPGRTARCSTPSRIPCAVPDGLDVVARLGRGGDVDVEVRVAARRRTPAAVAPRTRSRCTPSAPSARCDRNPTSRPVDRRGERTAAHDRERSPTTATSSPTREQQRRDRRLDRRPARGEARRHRSGRPPASGPSTPTARASGGRRTRSARGRARRTPRRAGPWPTCIVRGDSRAASASGERGKARKPVPNAFTNVAAASPPVRRRPPRPRAASSPRPPRSTTAGVDERLEQQPLAHEPVERRERR